MGYDLHITRRVHWSSEGDDITSDEWLSIVATDPELRLQPENGPFFATWSGISTLISPWLNWSNGQISTKNPDDALINKMVAIARKLGAVVQGDDGELYNSAQDAHKPRETVSFFTIYFRRLGLWLEKWFIRPKLPVPPFRVGDRVVNSFGNLGIVKTIDRRAEHGYGTICVRYDNGSEETMLLFAHGLSRYSNQEDDLGKRGQNKC
jgi:hypothetical protein